MCQLYRSLYISATRRLAGGTYRRLDEGGGLIDTQSFVAAPTTAPHKNSLRNTLFSASLTAKHPRNDRFHERRSHRAKHIGKYIDLRPFRAAKAEGVVALSCILAYESHLT